jgi:protein-S-isoprenylcysteine O-methyltransferase Ste14
VVLLIKNLLFTIVVPGTVCVVLPRQIAGEAGIASGVSFVLALLLFGLGAAVYAWCVWDFASLGRGTPAPIDAPRRLVVRGLYRFTRNPMYVGILTIVVAWALLFRQLEIVVYALTVATCFHLFILLYEEPHLERIFGSDYCAYRAEVGRWLPRMRRPHVE